MSVWQINIVTAFGRGETLALSLKEQEFDVHVFDFTERLSKPFHSGVGPFPILQQGELPSQQYALKVVKPLKNGLVFWLPEGPVELAGPLATHFADKVPAVNVLKSGTVSADFKEDWLRRFLIHWVCPFHFESWETPRSQIYPWDQTLALWPTEEQLAPSFERFAKVGHHIKAKELLDVQLEHSRLTEVEIEAGQIRAWRAPQWIWCLSSAETQTLNAGAASSLFNREVRTPEWNWLFFKGRAERGPWTSGFPEYEILIHDEALPWCYANVLVLRWLNEEEFQAWIKVPAQTLKQVEIRSRWAHDVQEALLARLPLARWKIDETDWAVCPQAQVLEAKVREWRPPNWKNWDWIAPETLPRLDWSARYKREAESLERLVQWRNEMIKKQGAKSDPALHAP